MALTLGMALALGVASCGENPAQDVPAAQIGESQSAAQDNAEQAVESESGEMGGQDAGDNSASNAGAADENADGEGMAGDEAESGDEAMAGGALPLTGVIAAKGSKVTGAHDLVFEDWSGTVDLGDGTPENVVVEFEVQTASVVTDPESRGPMSDRLDNHLRSDDFFASDQYPTATFVSTSIVEGGEGDATHTITGDFTLRGITKSITFPATVTVDGANVSAQSEFVLNRQDFEVSFAGQPDDLIRDEVVLVIDIATDAEEA